MKSADLAIPILPSRSLPRTVAFYEKLGFAGQIIHGNYAIMERGDLELHFFLHTELQPTESAFGCYLRVADVAAIHQAFSRAGLPSHGLPRLTAVEVKPWGMTEFALVDEDGTLVRVGKVT